MSSPKRKPLKMTSNTVWLYYNFTENDAFRVSARENSKALQLFWMRTGLEPEEIKKDAKGKPYFPSGRFHLSVTHTGNLYVCAIGEKPLGIDAERREETRPRIAAKKFSPAERTLPFSQVWCAKEAVSKLVGDGIKRMMQVKVWRDRAELDGKAYTLKEMFLGEYRLVIATEEGWEYGAETLSEK